MARAKNDFLIIRDNGSEDLYTGPDAEQRAADSADDTDRIYAGRGIVEMKLTSIRRLLPAEPPAPKKPRKARKPKAKSEPPPAPDYNEDAES